MYWLWWVPFITGRCLYLYVIDHRPTKSATIPPHWDQYHILTETTAEPNTYAVRINRPWATLTKPCSVRMLEFWLWHPWQPAGNSGNCAHYIRQLITYLSTLPHPLSPQIIITPLNLCIVCLLYLPMHTLTSIFIHFFLDTVPLWNNLSYIM